MWPKKTGSNNIGVEKIEKERQTRGPASTSQCFAINYRLVTESLDNMATR